MSLWLQCRAYWRAARPVAYASLGLPLLIGQLLAPSTSSAHTDADGHHSAAAAEATAGPDTWASVWPPSSLLLVHVHGFVLQAVILYLNDYADVDTDRLNSTFYASGGSRVLVNGMLRPAQLLRAALLLSIGDLLALLLLLPTRPWMALHALSFLVAGWVYSMRPFHASFRGYGELVQSAALGLMLPLQGFYLQSGLPLSQFPFRVALVLMPLFYAANVNNALADYPSDLRSRRRTLAVRSGQPHARRSILALEWLCCLAAWSTDCWRPACALMLAVTVCVGWVCWREDLVRRADVATDRALCKRWIKLHIATQVTLTVAFAAGCWLAR